MPFCYHNSVVTLMLKNSRETERKIQRKDYTTTTCLSFTYMCKWHWIHIEKLGNAPLTTYKWIHVYTANWDYYISSKYWSPICGYRKHWHWLFKMLYMQVSCPCKTSKPSIVGRIYNAGNKSFIVYKASLSQQNHFSTISVSINKIQVVDKHSFAICPFLIEIFEDINIIDLSGKTAGHKGLRKKEPAGFFCILKTFHLSPFERFLQLSKVDGERWPLRRGDQITSP